MRWIVSRLLLAFAILAILAATPSLAQAPPLPVAEKPPVKAAPKAPAPKVPAQAPVRKAAANPAAQPLPGGEKLPPVKDVTPEEVVAGTVFNGQDVPPMVSLSGTTIKEDISKGYWLVEAFSPYCHHCKSLAPKWQTLYEFYYTSTPLPASTEPIDTKTSLNSFNRYYNMKFAKLDCVAFGTACSEFGVKSYPSIILFKEGVEVKRSSGDRSMKDLSKFIEELLEIIRPGSRPTGGVELPEVGATTFASTRDPSEDTAAKSTADDTEKQVVPENALRKPIATVPENALKKPTKAAHMPNTSGTSVPLNGESFEQNIRKSLNPWFVKFYVPWCAHCQKLAPGWSALAREMKDKLDIGEVNCDVEKQLCRDYGVRGYPTIALFKGPERIDYDGLRGVGDLVKWAGSAVDASGGVRDVTAAEFEEMELEEEVIFLYFHDVATTTEDLMALERLPLHLVGRAKLVKTNDLQLVRRFKITTWPRLLVSRSGSTTVYDQLAPQDMRNVNKVVDWMQTVWLPLVPELTATNARDIMDGKYVVLGILNRDRPEEITIAQRELKSAAIEWLEKQAHQFQLERQELRDAKQLRIEEAEDRNDQRALMNAKRIRIDMNEVQHKEVGFAWVDGIFWERWVRTTFGISVRDGEKVIINDEDNRRYWDNTVTGNHIVPSRTSILETLSRVVASPPKLAPKPNGSTLMHYVFRARTTIVNHAYIAIAVAVACALSILLCCLRSRRKSRNGGFFHLDGNQSGRLMGAGLPNGNKAD